VPKTLTARHRAAELEKDAVRYPEERGDPFNSTNPVRGPMLIISGEKDHTVPRAISDAIYAKQKRNHGVTEFVEMPDRGH
jgi:dipeptidyl aminopeptidase/acylaminoacyl peptidase